MATSPSQHELKVALQPLEPIVSSIPFPMLELFKMSTRKTFRCLLLAGCLLIQAHSQAVAENANAAPTATVDRPNVLWISCEDISPQLGCYGAPHADTPNLDRLASQGVKFTRAFTPAGVCAVVRSSVITGMYAPSIGSQHMRSRIVPPPEVKCFSEYLRAAGYFCTNRSKTDYQFAPPITAWDRQGNNHGDWRDREDPDQPFFSVVNLTISHESQARHGEAARQRVVKAIGTDRVHDPNVTSSTMPPYFPDTPAARQNWAWYHDNITRMDQQVGEILDRLEADGLAESTLVVFWSDHGMGLPRGKRWIYDSGTHIPMIARWPGEIEPGTEREDLVSVIDLPPTMLRLAGIRPPTYMHGRTILGPETESEPAYLFFHRDRMDEVYELQRGARDRRWKYIRNYEPEKPYAQHLDYMDQMPAMRDWRAAAKAGSLTAAQKPWFQKTKPVEELYDTLNDPWELQNLADESQYSDRLSRMRLATEQWQENIGDMGLIPEPVMMQAMGGEHVRPSTAAPEVSQRNHVVTLHSPTNGASIAFRIKTSAEWSPWRLYTGPLEFTEATQLEAKAVRIGYGESATSQLSWQPQ